MTFKYSKYIDVEFMEKLEKGKKEHRIEIGKAAGWENAEFTIIEATEKRIIIHMNGFELFLSRSPEDEYIRIRAIVPVYRAMISYVLDEKTEAFIANKVLETLPKLRLKYLFK